MRIRQLLSELRCALRVSKIPCDLSEADLQAILRESADDVGDPHRTRCIIECAVHRAEHACEEISANGRAPVRKRARKKRSLGRKPSR
jgi:hypothetical protein